MKKLSALFSVLLMSLVAFAASAQSNPRYGSQQPDRYIDQGAYVTVFEDCDFRGKSRALTVGDYNNVRDLNIGNDSISSVAVPKGLEIVLYEHENQRGKSTAINSDVRCLNDAWNDEASSLRVIGGQGYTPRQPEFDQTRRNNNLNNRSLTAGVNYVEFSNVALEQQGNNQWRIENRNGSLNSFTETSRNREVIYLRNNNFQQNVEINFRSNTVVFIAPNGQRTDYPILHSDKRRSNTRATNNVIPSGCFTYRAYTTGGQGGIRFHGHDGFHRFSKKAHTDRICHNGALTMELNKTSPDTEVIVEINNQKYRFGRNEQADAFKNTWYRKKITLQVGR